MRFGFCNAPPSSLRGSLQYPATLPCCDALIILRSSRTMTNTATYIGTRVMSAYTWQTTLDTVQTSNAFMCMEC
ncbi:hypothetical protein RHGRI_013612 [Rhododendron griersonianum]|uniref:Uncharacterized protein n=1 Tax=Rhododendron griersonianum TaxID=479676 RepID=A0AAV6K6D1_9ERIC|nr:hypothetical protein RHGRI_013612 [Rhododendron griersonianum]